MNHDDVEILETEDLHRGFFELRRHRLRFRLFEGGWSEPISREVFVRGDAVAVLPYDPVLDRVVLVEQIRAGTLRDAASPWQIEPVAGVIDAGETPEGVARREAVEEAGLELGELVDIGGGYPSPGGMSEFVHFFIARADLSAAGGVHGLVEDGENIRVHCLPLDTALDWLRTGRIRTVTAMVTLQRLLLDRDSLRARWQAGADGAAPLDKR